MKLLILMFACLFSFTTYAQQANTAKAKKVFLEVENKNAHDRAIQLLKNDPQWQIADKREDADVVLDIKMSKIFFNDRKAYASFVDAKTNETLFTTKPVNTLARFTFAPRKGAIAKLFRKRINGVVTLKA